MHTSSGTAADTSKKSCHFSTESGIHFILDVSCVLNRQTTIKTVCVSGHVGWKTHLGSGLPIHLPHVPADTAAPSRNTHSTFGKLQNHCGYARSYCLPRGCSAPKKHTLQLVHENTSQYPSSGSLQQFLPTASFQLSLGCLSAAILHTEWEN